MTTTAAFYLRRIVHLAAVVDGTPADHALCGMNLQYGAIDTTADATCGDCRTVAARLESAEAPAETVVEKAGELEVRGLALCHRPRSCRRCARRHRGERTMSNQTDASIDQPLAGYAVTVTPTIMDGTVVRWHEGRPERKEVISASRNAVVSHGGRLTPSLFNAAWSAHRALAHGEDVRHLATHERTRLFGDEWREVAR